MKYNKSIIISSISPPKKPIACFGTTSVDRRTAIINIIVNHGLKGKLCFWHSKYSWFLSLSIGLYFINVYKIIIQLKNCIKPVALVIYSYTSFGRMYESMTAINKPTLLNKSA